MKNEKICLFVILIILLVIFSKPVFAESSHVLPYPSRMPGSLTYKYHLIFEDISKYWHFGDFGQFIYSLKLADKYLVEAKTLFEYKQYLLGNESLKKSDLHFSRILPALIKAKKNNKNIIQKKLALKEAALKHIETLEETEAEIPNTFIWQPEKSIPKDLYLKKTIENSIKIRKTGL